MEMKKQIKILKEINKFFRETNEEEKSINDKYLTYDYACMFEPLTKELKELFIKFRPLNIEEQSVDIQYNDTNQGKYNREYMKKIYNFFDILGETPIIQIGEDLPITFKSESLKVILAPEMFKE